MRLVMLCCLAAVTAGCFGGSGDNRSVLTDGIGPGASGKVHRVTATDALAGGHHINRLWRANIFSRARRYRRQRFDNPSRTRLLTELRHFARQYDFDVVTARVLRPRQDAPMIVVSTTHYLRLAQATASILKELDPRQPRVQDDRQGWRYEGFYWEARDERGVPFLITSTLTRGQVEGQQWARSEPLYPFEHG